MGKTAQHWCWCASCGRPPAFKVTQNFGRHEVFYVCSDVRHQPQGDNGEGGPAYLYEAVTEGQA